MTINEGWIAWTLSIKKINESICINVDRFRNVMLSDEDKWVQTYIWSTFMCLFFLKKITQNNIGTT